MDNTDAQEKRRTASQRSASKTSFFTAPEPIQRLFRKVPLITYPADELPHRSRRHQSDNVLYIFTTESGVRMDTPSFNPGCLKWQTYLKFLDVPFITKSSSNHASPTGALPFLLPKTSFDPIPWPKLESWLKKELQKEQPAVQLRQQPYLSLLAQPIRLAYLHALYLDDETFKNVAVPYYIHPNSMNPLVRAAMAPPLRGAALEQLLASQPLTADMPVLDLERLYKDADDAFEALDALLGDCKWFASVKDNPQRESYQDDTSTSKDQQEIPGMLDASVFAYTHVILTLFAFSSDASPAGRLRTSITGRSSLLDHHTRVARQYYHSPR